MCATINAARADAVRLGVHTTAPAGAAPVGRLPFCVPSMIDSLEVEVLYPA
jgi:hypothetical protein